MTRTEYLTQLDKYLKKLPQPDYQEAMDYFTEYFDEVGPEGEAAAMADLGSPKEAAHEIISNILDKQLSTETLIKNRKKTLWIAILTIFAAPIGLPFLILLILFMLAVLAVIICVILALAAVTFAAFLLGATIIWDSLPLLTESLSAFLLTFGGGVMAIGISCLVFLAIFYVVRFGISLLIHMGKFFIKKMKRGA